MRQRLHSATERTQSPPYHDQCESPHHGGGFLLTGARLCRAAGRRRCGGVNPYPLEELHPNEDDGTIADNVQSLADEVVGHRIVKAERRNIKHRHWSYIGSVEAFVITLDSGKEVILRDTDSCCAYTELEGFFLDPDSVNHVILGVGTTGGYTTWHIYADFGDIMRLEVGWSPGNPFHYGYGFHIVVTEVPA